MKNTYRIVFDPRDSTWQTVPESTLLPQAQRPAAPAQVERPAADRADVEDERSPRAMPLRAVQAVATLFASVWTADDTILGAISEANSRSLELTQQ